MRLRFQQFATGMSSNVAIITLFVQWWGAQGGGWGVSGMTAPRGVWSASQAACVGARGLCGGVGRCSPRSLAGRARERLCWWYPVLLNWPPSSPSPPVLEATLIAPSMLPVRRSPCRSSPIVLVAPGIATVLLLKRLGERGLSLVSPIV